MLRDCHAIHNTEGKNVGALTGPRGLKHHQERCARFKIRASLAASSAPRRNKILAAGRKKSRRYLSRCNATKSRITLHQLNKSSYNETSNNLEKERKEKEKPKSINFRDLLCLEAESPRDKPTIHSPNCTAASSSSPSTQTRKPNSDPRESRFLMTKSSTSSITVISSTVRKDTCMLQ